MKIKVNNQLKVKIKINNSKNNKTKQIFLNLKIFHFFTIKKTKNIFIQTSKKCKAILTQSRMNKIQKINKLKLKLFLNLLYSIMRRSNKQEKDLLPSILQTQRANSKANYSIKYKLKKLILFIYLKISNHFQTLL